MNNSFSRVTTSAVLMAGVLFAPSAAAHDQLISTNPAAGATVNKAPADLSLTFNNAPLTVGHDVIMTTPSGQRKPITPKAAGTSLTIPFTAAGNGKYQVVWRVVSSDGHPISGEFDFTLTGAGPASTGSSPTASGGHVSTSRSSKPVGTPERRHSDKGSNPWIVVGAVAGGVIVLVGLAARLTGRRSDPNQQAGAGAEADDE